MTGVEIDFVVKDSIETIEKYEKIFEVKRIEVTSFPKGQNEAIFSIFESRFHILDENPEFNLFAPTPDKEQSIWFNVLVEDIKDTYEKAMNNGCISIQPITDMHDFGVSNAIFKDEFGYVWMLHEIHRIVSFEDRVKLFGEKEN